MMAPAKPRVLVVDDDAGIRAALRDLLGEEGVDVVGDASDAIAGLAMVAELRPDVVLMDLRMPEMDGVEATLAIKALDPNIQVVILSAYDDEVLSQGAKEAGVFAYLIKGCAAGVVRETVYEAWRVGQVSGSSGGNRD